MLYWRIHGPCNCRTRLNESTHGSHTHYYVSTLDFEARILGMSLKPKLYNSCVIFFFFFSEFTIFIFQLYELFHKFHWWCEYCSPISQTMNCKLMVHLERNKIQRVDEFLKSCIWNNCKPGFRWFKLFQRRTISTKIEKKKD